jgi:hypothetical protein
MKPISCVVLGLAMATAAAHGASAAEPLVLVKAQLDALTANVSLAKGALGAPAWAAHSVAGPDLAEPSRREGASFFPAPPLGTGREDFAGIGSTGFGTLASATSPGTPESALGRPTAGTEATSTLPAAAPAGSLSDGGSTLGGSTLGGSTLGGSTLGGSTLGGSTLGGSITRSASSSAPDLGAFATATASGFGVSSLGVSATTGLGFASSASRSTSVSAR